MATPTLFDGTLSNPVGKTSFGYFDGDPKWMNDAPKIADWIARKLGYPTVDIEIDEKDLYNAIEEAIVEFSNLVNQHNIEDKYLLLKGIKHRDEYENLTGTHVTGTPLREVIRLARSYGSEVGHGGNVEWRKAFIDLENGKQVYDLDKALMKINENYITDENGDPKIDEDTGKPLDLLDEDRKIIVKEVWYSEPNVRTGSNTLSEFANSTTGEANAINAGLWRMTTDYHHLLRTQALEINDHIWRSHYSYRLNNNKLTITPVPGSTSFYGGAGSVTNPDQSLQIPRIWFDYVFEDEADGIVTVCADENGITSDYSNVPYDIHPYGGLNSPSKRWVHKYALEEARYKLGMVRNKYSGTIPGTKNDLNLDGSDLISNAEQRMETLKNDLKEILDKLTTKNQLQKSVEETEAQQELMNKIPTLIYKGHAQ